MSFVRLTADDFVVSSDAISATAWTTGNPTLSTFFTSSTQENGSSGDYYLNVYNTSSAISGSAVQFAIAYGNGAGSGSLNYNNLVNGYSPTSTIFGLRSSWSSQEKTKWQLIWLPMKEIILSKSSKDRIAKSTTYMDQTSQTG